MILWMSSLGFLSAFALGPASFSIIRSLITKRQWPWSSIAGFLLGDVIYIAAAVLILKSPLLYEPLVKTILTTLTILALSFYSLNVLFFSGSKNEPFEKAASSGFRQSLLLTLSNFHLVLIYAGLFVNLSTQSPSSLYSGILIYLVTFIVSFLGLLAGMRIIQESLQKTLRKIEILVACGFLGFSFYLSWGIL